MDKEKYSPRYRVTAEWTSNAPVAFLFQNNDKSGYSKPNMTVMLTWITFCKTRHFVLFEN